MSGVLLAFIASIILVFADAGKKKLSLRYATPVIVWNHLLIAVTLNLAFLWSQGRLESWKMHDPMLFVYGAVAMFFGELTFMRSLRAGDFSLSQPFKAFSPIMAIPLSLLILNEYPSLAACVGVCICTTGTWLMFSSHAKEHGFFAPFYALVRDHAPQAMIVSVFFGALVACLLRLASAHDDSVWFFTYIFGLEYLFFTIYLFWERHNPILPLRTEPLLLIGTGILWGCGMTLVYVAAAYTQVINVYVISQLQPVLALGIAHWVFREHHAKSRILPTVCMVIGVLIVVIFK